MAHSVKVFLFVITIAAVYNEAHTLSSLDRSYQKGVEAHKGERWSECIKQFEETIHLYNLYKAIIVNCRLKCKSEQSQTKAKDGMEELKMYETFFNAKNCLTKCQEVGFDEVHLKKDVSDSTIDNMQMRKPYEYLHMCYFQMYALPKAASATYTFLVANPEDEAMQANLKYYVEQPEVDRNEVVDLQSEDYMVLYKLGLKTYDKKNWRETIASMEEVITDYLSSENRCRVECERQPEQEWSPEFMITISNSMASLLHCQQHCQDKLKPIGYDSGLEFLADVLNYIQFSYYNLDRFNDAAQAVASYLSILPYDEDMLENKKIYSTMVPENSFNERSDIIHYFKRDNYEKKLLMLFHAGHNKNIDTNTI